MQEDERKGDKLEQSTEGAGGMTRRRSEQAGRRGQNGCSVSSRGNSTVRRRASSEGGGKGGRAGGQRKAWLRGRSG